MINTGYAIAIIIVASICTYATRAAPFAIFGNKKEMPKQIKYLANVLPPAIIATLLVYCLKDTTSQSFSTSLLSFLAIGVVVILHIWKKDTLLSISGGTIFYMILIRVIL